MKVWIYYTVSGTIERKDYENSRLSIQDGEGSQRPQRYRIRGQRVYQASDFSLIGEGK